MGGADQTTKYIEKIANILKDTMNILWLGYLLRAARARGVRTRRIYQFRVYDLLRTELNLIIRQAFTRENCVRASIPHSCSRLCGKIL